MPKAIYVSDAQIVRIGVILSGMFYCTIYLDIEEPYKPWEICVTKLSYKEAI
jgi:hypothetical protein